MIRLVLSLSVIALMTACGAPEIQTAPQSTIQTATANINGKTFTVYWDTANKTEAWTQINKRDTQGDAPDAVEAIRQVAGCRLAGSSYRIQHTLKRDGTPVAVLIRELDC